MPTADIPGLPIAYAAMLAMLIVPQFVLIHPYLHLLIMGPLLVWIGCQRSLLESLKAPGESQVGSEHRPLASTAACPSFTYHVSSPGTGELGAPAPT
jgi:hypothetical protein